MLSSQIDQLEIEFGTAILFDLVGEPLIRNQQPVRLFDQTKHTAEYYYRADQRGKPFIKNFQTDECWFPLTAYCKVHNMDFTTAAVELGQQYGLINLPTTAERTRKDFKRPNPNHALITHPQSFVNDNTPITYIPKEIYQKSQSQFVRNGFYQYLVQLLDKEKADYLFAQYRLGTSREWKYENTFATSLPQFDKAGNLRQVKVIPFHPNTGRRAKPHHKTFRLNHHTGQYEPDLKEKVWFAGKSLIRNVEAKLQSCFFGEHLLAEHPDKQVALVEGESTAVVCSAYSPKQVWLATGGNNGCRWYEPNVFKVLKNRHVMLWPDTGKYDEWVKRASLLHHIPQSLIVSSYVEDNAPAGTKNIDLRDLRTGPCWLRDGKLIFGETLESVPGDYPPDWDS
ncbi:hypothetical protein GCM10028808_30330 [Spirosoma migulaei]